MRKSDSIAWKHAKTLSRRKHVLWVPVDLSNDGEFVTVQGIIRGNIWTYTKNDLADYIKNRKLFKTMKTQSRLFYIEVTDTFGGEANYSWVTRHVIRANTMRGAVNRFSRLSDMQWHCVGDYSDSKRYDSKSGATCYFIEEFDPENYRGGQLSTDER